MVLSFVDFVSPAHAATAMDAIQGQCALMDLLYKILCSRGLYLVVDLFFLLDMMCMCFELLHDCHFYQKLIWHFRNNCVKIESTSS